MVEVRKGVHAIDLSEGDGLGLEVWLLNSPEGLILIDTGMRESAFNRIGTELRARWLVPKFMRCNIVRAG